MWELWGWLMVAAVVLGVLNLLLSAVNSTLRVFVPTEKKCPQCAERVKREAVVCRYCGHSFEEAVEEGGTSEPDTSLVERAKGHQWRAPEASEAPATSEPAAGPARPELQWDLSAMEASLRPEPRRRRPGPAALGVLVGSFVVLCVVSLIVAGSTGPSGGSVPRFPAAKEQLPSVVGGSPADARPRGKPGPLHVGGVVVGAKAESSPPVPADPIEPTVDAEEAKAERDREEFTRALAGIEGASMLIAGVRRGITADDLELTVSNLWFDSTMNRQVRLQVAQSLWQAWAALHSPDNPDRALISLRDRMGNRCGGSSAFAGSLIRIPD